MTDGELLGAGVSPVRRHGVFLSRQGHGTGLVLAVREGCGV